MAEGFEVRPFGREQFLGLLCEASGASPRVVRKKPQFSFFLDYLKDLDCRTILVERVYIDHDFLEDYASYYVKCFQGFKKECARLHFFGGEFEETEFYEKIVRGGEIAKGFPREGYLGFMVVKPLPSSIFGRTCIKHYPADGGRRCFSVCKKFEANLFGAPLEVVTLPFQEQDRVTAACASSALWSGFQATAQMFNHPVPSPVEITKMAARDFPLRSRILPNTEGLTLEQMAHAIQGVGLEPCAFEVYSKEALQSLIYSYVNFGVPPILVLDLRKNGGESFGKHAVCVTGYSIPPERHLLERDDGYSFVSDGVDEIYVHDDQIGPHSRMFFRGEGSSFWLSTSWENFLEKEVHAIPEMVFVPLYHKIRIPFSVINDVLTSFSPGVGYVGATALGVSNIYYLWDVRLKTVQDFKKEVWADPESCHGKEILFESLPRFLWQATAYRESEPVLEILFDATDIDTGNFVLRVDAFEERLEEALKAFLRNESLMSQEEGKSLGAVFWRLSDKSVCLGEGRFDVAGR